MSFYDRGYADGYYGDYDPPGGTGFFETMFQDEEMVKRVKEYNAGYKDGKRSRKEDDK